MNKMTQVRRYSLKNTVASRGHPMVSRKDDWDFPDYPAGGPVVLVVCLGCVQQVSRDFVGILRAAAGSPLDSCWTSRGSPGICLILQLTIDRKRSGATGRNNIPERKQFWNTINGTTRHVHLHTRASYEYTQKTLGTHIAHLANGSNVYTLLRG